MMQINQYSQNNLDSNRVSLSNQGSFITKLISMHWGTEGILLKPDFPTLSAFGLHATQWAFKEVLIHPHCLPSHKCTHTGNQEATKGQCVLSLTPWEADTVNYRLNGQRGGKSTCVTSQTLCSQLPTSVAAFERLSIELYNHLNPPQPRVGRINVLSPERNLPSPNWRKCF